ncbi:MAG: hypothetical protein CME71_11395 [Halobacteriovorax sp.]|nr:hypothetical protein [Halobacteriovorax sp.]
MVIVDGTIEQAAWVSVRANKNINEQLVSVLSPYDAPSTGNVKGFLRPYIRPRSFAVNIMRHGAPLDLEV